MAELAITHLVDWPEDRPLQLSGRPESFRIPFALDATPDVAHQASQVVLRDVQTEKGEPLRTRSARIGFDFGMAGPTRGKVHLRLDPAALPGIYSGSIEIAGNLRPIEITVVERVEMAVSPSPLVLDAEGGPVLHPTVRFENRGNTSLTIDVTGDYPIGEEVPVTAPRDETPETDGIQRLLGLLTETLVGSGPRRAVRPFGTIGLSMPAVSIRLEPGESATSELTVRLPQGLSPQARYRAFIPIYTADLDIVVVTAKKAIVAKPAKRSSRAKSPPRGAGT